MLILKTNIGEFAVKGTRKALLKKKDIAEKGNQILTLISADNKYASENGLVYLKKEKFFLDLNYVKILAITEIVETNTRVKAPVEKGLEELGYDLEKISDLYNEGSKFEDTTLQNKIETVFMPFAREAALKRSLKVTLENYIEFLEEKKKKRLLEKELETLKEEKGE